MTKIGIFRALHLGDTLCALPAVRTLKQSFSISRLYYIGLPSMRSFLSRYSYIDEVVPFPGCYGLPEQHFDWDRTEAFNNEMRSKQFDLLIQMQGNGTIVNEMLAGWNAKRLVGFCPQTNQSSENWLPYPKSETHEIDRHLNLLQHLGITISPQDRKIDFPLHKEDWTDNIKLIKAYDLKRYAIMHVGSSTPSRRLPLEKFAHLAQHINRHKIQIILTGSCNERELTKKMCELLPDVQMVNLAGETNLGQLGCLVKGAALLVSNCTSISHIAAALETKSIIFSMDGEPERWGPINKTLHHTHDVRTTLNLDLVCNEIDELLFK